MKKDFLRQGLFYTGQSQSSSSISSFCCITEKNTRDMSMLPKYQVAYSSSLFLFLIQRLRKTFSISASKEHLIYKNTQVSSVSIAISTATKLSLFLSSYIHVNMPALEPNKITIISHICKLLTNWHQAFIELC